VAIKCPKCNSDNPDSSRFCSDCGTQIVSIKDASVTKTIQEPAVSSGKTMVRKYKILAELGRGGMGVVYKAKDTRLKRTVALKFLPAELTQDKEAKKRFIQEAQAAAALEHPNICTVYEVDEAEGQTFIAMSYIEGHSLKDKLQDGPIDVDGAKDIAIQVAEGLKEAHKKGIVHRDIKPANIMLDDEGRAKITDFGLAKLSWGVDLTKPSTILGTVAYMSPEQAKGEEVDHRTDIWSLGAMLYEMLSGERPFKKSHEQALIHSILNDEPKPIAEIRANIPRQFEEIIYKALEKDTRTRYQSIQELMEDLKQSVPTTFPKAEKSIVVLPFDDMSPGKDNEYFSDGLTEEVISDLSSIQSLRVISRTSAMMLKGTKKSMKTIGRELDVQYVLEGSVRKAGNNLRITAQLIDATSDAHLWAKKYSGTLDDVFDIQEKVSRSIVDALKLKLSPEENQRMSERPIENIKAYECYLKANAEISKYTEEGLNLGIRYLQNGLDILAQMPYFIRGWHMLSSNLSI
jgi:serine/threonine protein kinase